MNRSKALAKMRRNYRNRMYRKQGAREIERRLHQMERNAVNLEARAAAVGFGLVIGGAE